MKLILNITNLKTAKRTCGTVILSVLSVLTVIITALSQTSCGYHVGSLVHPQIKTVAVAPVTNETEEPYVSADLRNAICEQIQFDGSLKLKDMKTADCIIFGRVVEVKTVATAHASFDAEQTFRAAEWEVQVTFEYEVIIPGKKRPLIPKRRVTGNAKYQIFTDPQTTRRRGVQQACRNAARQVVTYTVEAW